ncbi:MAG: sigma-70 family RNA polymerase sigma factor [Bacteroidales bacterium]|nr:sigma-70 family RNA polymerase sigma factor [Bacteroidales bacterium]
MDKIFRIFNSGKEQKLLDMLYGSIEDRDRAISILRKEALGYCIDKGRKMGFCREDILDLFQDAMLAFLESLEERKIKKNPTGYLKRIIKYKSIDKLNLKKDSKLINQEMPELSTDIDDDRNELMELSELAISKIIKAMDDINPKYKALLHHHYILGLSLNEIAVEQQSTPETVKTQLKRAREAVRGKF